MIRDLTKRLILVALIACILFSFGGPGFAKVPGKGDPSPVFSLKSVQGQQLDMAEQIGSKVIVLGLFHICEPCMNQALELQKLQEAMQKEDILVLGVNTSGDSRDAVQDYLNKFPRRVTFPYLLDPARTVERLFSVRATPQVYIIDKEGLIRFRGSSVPAPVLQKEVSGILR